MSNAPKPTTPKLTDEEIKTLAENEAAHKAAELAAVEQAIADDEAAKLLEVADVNPADVSDAVETVLLAEIDLPHGTDKEWWTPALDATLVEFENHPSFTALLKAQVYATFATDNEDDLRAGLNGVDVVVQQWVAKMDRA